MTFLILLGHLVWVQFVGAQTIHERCGNHDACTDGRVIWIWEGQANKPYVIRHEAEHCYASIKGIPDRTHFEGNKGFAEACATGANHSLIQVTATMSITTTLFQITYNAENYSNQVVTY